MSALRLPSVIQPRLRAMVEGYLGDGATAVIDFATPVGEPALAAPDSVSWRVFKNPIALYVGGLAAVVLELAEPRVRTGVWEHSTFVDDALGRLKRTGLAAMVTVYGPRSAAEKMIAGITRRHAQVRGTTPDGRPYRALEPELMRWVQVTASFGFIEAYHRFVEPLSAADRDRGYAEAIPGALLYGARDSPTDEQGVHALFDHTRPDLENSPIVHEFLDIMRATRALPLTPPAIQRMLIRASIDLVPPPIRRILGLADRPLSRWEARAVRALGHTLDHVVVPSAPPAQACVRMGLAPDYLYDPCHRTLTTPSRGGEDDAPRQT